MLTRRGKNDGRRVMLSGSGADEILSDYGFGGVKFFPHSSFGGKFPERLAEVFPWASFFLGTMRDYLMKDEIIAGFHGIEGRYPFLDLEVVQEFLWLAADVKNSQYKNALARYLQKHGYPLAHGKQGFGASTDLLVYDQADVEAPAVGGGGTGDDGHQQDLVPTAPEHRAPFVARPAPACGGNMYFVALRSRLTARVLDGDEFACRNPDIKRDREGLTYILFHDLSKMLTTHFGVGRFLDECAIGFYAARLLKTVDKAKLTDAEAWAELHIEMPDFKVKRKDATAEVAAASSRPGSAALTVGKQHNPYEIWHSESLGVRLPPVLAGVSPSVSGRSSWSEMCTSGFPVFRLLQRLPQLYAVHAVAPFSDELFALFCGKLHTFLQEYNAAREAGDPESKAATPEPTTEDDHREQNKSSLRSALLRFDDVFSNWIGENAENLNGVPTVAESVASFQATRGRMFDPMYYYFWLESDHFRRIVFGPLQLQTTDFELLVWDVIETLTNGWVTEPVAAELAKYCNRFLYINYADGTWCDGPEFPETKHRGLQKVVGVKTCRRSSRCLFDVVR
eukprot:g3142.t1